MSRALALAAAFAAGAAAVAGFAPLYWWPVPIASLVVLFWPWVLGKSEAGAFATGYAFGLGMFLVGVSWIYVSLHDYGGMPMALAALAVLLFSAYLALFPAIAGWVTVRFVREGAWRLPMAATSFTLLEWIRGWLFTGFPWLSMGTSQVPDSKLSGWATVAGTYGVTLAMAAVAACIALAAIPDHRRLRENAGQRFVVAAMIAALFIAGLEFGRQPWTSAAGKPVRIALLQGNIPQELKWRDDQQGPILRDYAAMIAAAPAKVVVLPETALPAFLDELPPAYLAALRDEASAHGKEILLGTVERTGPTTYYNSVVPLVASQAGSYRKRHLVPFGEFVPEGFKWVMAVLHIPLDDFARGAAVQPALAADGTTFGVAVCYEDLFGEEVIRWLPEAQMLLNVSNDAWFGHSLEPEQHLQGSQMRALETGRWMVRATNTGATAAIDPKGRVVSRLPGFTRGTLVAVAQPRAGMTPYARWGDLPVIVLALLVAVLAGWLSRRAT